MHYLVATIEVLFVLSRPSTQIYWPCLQAELPGSRLDRDALASNEQDLASTGQWLSSTEQELANQRQLWLADKVRHADSLHNLVGHPKCFPSCS